MKRLAIILLVALPLAAQTAKEEPRLPGKVSVTQKLGAQVPLDTMMRDETGRVVKLRDYFGSGRPVLLNFVYYHCPMLCPMGLEGLSSSLTELKFSIGKEFDIVTISMDPRDKPAEAAEFKDRYVKRYGRLNAAGGWHFLTSTDSSIRSVAQAVGFEYAYDGVRDQFAHNAALFILTPEGKVSRYLFGFEFKPRDLRLAIVEASAGTIGNVTDQILLLCYHYDPAIGKYSRNAMNFVRASGVTTVALLASFVVIMFRNERRKRQDSPNV